MDRARFRCGFGVGGKGGREYGKDDREDDGTEVEEEEKKKMMMMMTMTGA